MPPPRRELIVGGRVATPYDLPFAVSIGHVNSTTNGSSFWQHSCGGTLVADQWVLTARHCIPGCFDMSAGFPGVPGEPYCVPNIDELRVVLHTHNITSAHEEDEHPCSETLELTRVELHPVYFVDLALLELEASATCGAHIALPLNPGAEPPTLSGNATVVGWGHTSEGGGDDDYTDELRIVDDVHFVNNDVCADAYAETRFFDPALELCAGSFGVGGKGSCQGDSGGPLLLPLAADRTAPVSEQWVQVGVVSWGIGCARSWFPGVYVRTAPFADWIASVTAAPPPPPSPPPPATAPSAPMPWLPPPPTAPLPVVALAALAVIAVTAFGVAACLLRWRRRSRPALRELPMEAVATSSPDPSFKTRTTASPVMSSPDGSFRSTPSPTSRPGTPAPAPASGHEILARLARL